MAPVLSRSLSESNTTNANTPQPCFLPTPFGLRANIILNWNGKEDTLECLASIVQMDYPNYEVIVVDNGSTDGSVGTIRTKLSQFSMLENKKNLGFVRGNNVDIRKARESKRYFEDENRLRNMGVFERFAHETKRELDRHPRWRFRSAKT